MGIDQIEERLRHWKRRHGEMMAAYDALYRLTGCSPESQLSTALFDVWTAYTVAISEIVGDHDEWLQWFQSECDMGKRPKTMRFADGRELTVKTLRHLARVIATK